MKLWLHHPWGAVSIPEDKMGWKLYEISACCHERADETFCPAPEWQEQVNEVGGVVLAGPVFDENICACCMALVLAPRAPQGAKWHKLPKEMRL